jgi:hypothetical protein
MTSSAKPTDRDPVPQPPPYAPFAAFLSYLVPGLGQIIQGRVGKGLLFLACLYTLFFYGLFLGQGQAAVKEDNGRVVHYRVSSNVYLPTAEDRHQPDPSKGLQRLALDLYHRPQFLGQFWMGIVVWPAIWQYATYDTHQEHPILKDFMRTPDVQALNAVHTAGNKLLELGWVYTVIAGVLNIMVIYDALAGPALLAAAAAASSSSKPTPQPT